MMWPEVPLRELGVWYGGGTPSKSNPAFWTDGTMPWLSPKDMGPMTLARTIDKITEDAVAGSAVKRVPAGAVAMVMRSGILEHSFPVALVPFETTLNQDMKAIVPHPEVDPRWIAWGLRAFEREILRTTRKAGTTVASIETPRLQAFKIPLPPLEEQRRIVAILDDHLSRLDAADRLLEASAKRAKTLLRTALWTATHLPGETKMLSEIADVKLGRQRSPKNHSGADMVPYLRAANVDWNRLRLEDVKTMNFTAAEREMFLLRSGDILLTEASGSPGEVGKSVVYRGEPPGVCFQNTVLRVRCFDANPDYVQRYLLAEAYAGRFVAESRGVGIHHLGRTRLSSWPISLPDRYAQDAAVEAADELLSAITRLVSELAGARKRGDGLRRALLARAFSDGTHDARTSGGDSVWSPDQDVIR